MPKPLSNREIEGLYDTGQYRLNQERLDFILPQIVDFVESKQWLNLHPEYQRRLVWDEKKKSLLIESLLMNVPIPPVFLLEYEFNRYEVMDGQQRLNTIVDFYRNRFSLSGLEVWKALNGRTYDQCPPLIRRGLDRRRVSSTVLLAESGREVEQIDKVRRTVFERLNTGGQNLNAQELRHCLYHGKFNDLIVELAGNREFDVIWEIPPYEDNIRNSHISDELRDNQYFKRMIDCEIVLRFFAFRRKSKLKGAVKRILDDCMKDYMVVPDTTIDELRQRFLTRLKLARRIFGKNTFKVRTESGKIALSLPLYDAVMVGLDNSYEHRNALVHQAKRIRERLMEQLNDDDTYEIVVGRPNTTKAIRVRQKLIQDILDEHI